MYITFFRPPQQNITQISFEDLFNNFNNIDLHTIPNNMLYTQYPRKITVWNPNFNPNKFEKIEQMLYALDTLHTPLWTLLNRESPREELYETFYIPKHSGGLRRIDAPKAELMDLFKIIQQIFENSLLFQAHDCAYAYVKQRTAHHALQEHQKNKSKWFLKLDIKNFFPSCTKEIILNAFNKVYPFAYLIKTTETAKTILTDIAELAVLNNQLPQGTPLSPLLTNIIMIPYDYKIQHTMFKFQNQRFIYTRYADDILISSKYNFNWQTVQNKIQELLTPFQIKTEKTRYGSAAGRNWNLGLMLNKDNQITIGHKRKEQFKVTLYKFLSDFAANRWWDKHDVQILIGQLSYYKQIEPNYFNNLVRKYEQKTNLIFNNCTKTILNTPVLEPT